MYINKSKEQGNPRERSMEPENSNLNLMTKYPASKARKRDAAKTTKKTNKCGVVGNSIIIVES